MDKEGHGLLERIALEGIFDVPKKGADKAQQWESEEVYTYLIGAVCPMKGQKVALPDCGFLWPAFKNRCTDLEHVNVYQKDAEVKELRQLLNL